MPDLLDFSPLGEASATKRVRRCEGSQMENQMGKNMEHEMETAII